MSAISGNVARERFDEVRHRNSCSRYPGKIRPSLCHPKVSLYPSSISRFLASHWEAEYRRLTRERRRCSRTCNSELNFYRSTTDVIGNPAEHAASFYINPPPSSNDIHCWTALMARLSPGLLKLSVVRLILRITEEGTFSEVFWIRSFCVFA